MVEWVFEYLISVGFETHETLQLPFQMKIDRDWKLKECEKILLRFLMECVYITNWTKIKDFLYWINITIAFTQIGCFSCKQKTLF